MKFSPTKNGKLSRTKLIEIVFENLQPNQLMFLKEKLSSWIVLIIEPKIFASLLLLSNFSTAYLQDINDSSACLKFL